MARPRTYIRDEHGKTVDGLSLHKPSRRFYSLTALGDRVYWGRDRNAAIRDFRGASEEPVRKDEVFQRLSDDDAEMRVIEEWGVKPEHVTPQLIAQAKSNRWYINEEALAKNPKLKESIDYISDVSNGRARARVLHHGFRSLAQVSKRWRKDKEGEITARSIDDYLVSWRQFLTIARKEGILHIAKLDKDFLRHYRETIKGLAKGSANYYSNRFRHVKAILRHVLTEHDVAELSPEKEAYIRENLKMLKTKTVRGSKRLLAPAELHSLLSVCDQLAAIDPKKIAKELANHRCATCNPVSQKRCSTYQSLAGQAVQAEHRRILGVQFRAIYLLAVNCMFYPVDLSTIPRGAVNLETGHLTFRRGKTAQPRVGFLLPQTIDALKEWMEIRSDQSDMLFLTTAGSAWTQKTLHSNLTKHKRRAKLAADLTWKSFRKGAYTAALADPSVDIFTAKILAGHATGITDDYVEANPERCRKAVEAIGQHYFAQSVSTAA